METTTSVLPFGPSASSTSKTSAGFSSTDIDQFIGLMIAELQNQDPLDPMDNSEMMQQITQIREISASDRLTETLESVMLGQNFATASGLIGKKIEALPDLATQTVTGVVDRISVQVDEKNSGQRILRVHIGDQTVQMENIKSILAAPSKSAPEDDAGLSQESELDAAEASTLVPELISQLAKELSAELTLKDNLKLK